MPSVISKIRKNTSEDIWVTLQDYLGKTRLDVRIFFRSADVHEPTPTRKGVALDRDQISGFIAALERFQADGASMQIIPKSKRYDLRVYTAPFADRQLVHVRSFYRDDANGEMKPTGRGVAFDPSLLPRVIDAIKRAEKELARSE